ncbi:MAG: cupin [Acidobacteria bacterium]|nr:cupin [Acidobacteriota bacterium]|tara:strand:- start:1637 stop:1966 length:330 start_codon:yes stop_codon:yes gene_type:complete
MKHPNPFDPRNHATYTPDKMGKTTIFRSERILVGLNAFEPGQEHAVHEHEGMDKVYHVVEGQGLFLLGKGETQPMQAGMMLVAPEGTAHGIRNIGTGRLLVVAILAPAP